MKKLLLMMALLVISGCGSEPEDEPYSFQSLTSDGEWQERVLVHGYKNNLEACIEFIKSGHDKATVDDEDWRDFRCVVLDDKPDASQKENSVKPDSDVSLSDIVLRLVGFSVLILMLIAVTWVMFINFDFVVALVAFVIILWILVSVIRNFYS